MSDGPKYLFRFFIILGTNLLVVGYILKAWPTVFVVSHII